MGCNTSEDSDQEECDTNKPLNADVTYFNLNEWKSQVINEGDTLPVKQGYLFDHGIKTWMVLTRRYLFSYRDEKDIETEIERLDLFVFDTIKQLHDIYDDAEHSNQFSFRLSSSVSNRKFAAESQQEMVHWIDTIRQCQSIHAGFLKNKSSRKKWRTCVLAKDFLFIFRDKHISQTLDVLDLSYFDHLVVSNIEEPQPTKFKLISTQNKAEPSVTLTARSSREMKQWMKQIGFVQHSCALRKYKQTLKSIEFESEGKDQEPQPALKATAVAFKPVLGAVPVRAFGSRSLPFWTEDEENEDKDLDIFNKTEVKCKGIYDCFAIKRIRSLMSLYDEHKNSNHTQSLSLMDIIQNAFNSKYDMLRILNDYIHIIQTHDVCLEDLCFNQCDLNKCNAFKRHRGNRMKPYTDNAMEASTGTIVTVDIMDQIHCYLHHTFDTGHRLTKQEQIIVEKVGNSYHVNKAFNTIRNILVEKKQKLNMHKEEGTHNKFLTVNESKSCDDDGSVDGNIFSPGTPGSHPLDYATKHSEQSVLSKYSTLKDELTSNNNVCFVSMSQWLHVYDKANKFQKTDYAKSLQGKNHDALYGDDFLYGFGIGQYSDLPINNLIVIMFYTDFDELTFKIKQTFKEETYSDTLRQHSSYYWFCKILRETVELYGKDYEGRTMYNEHVLYLYHNISSCNRFGSSTVMFRQPVSVTTHLIVAQRYGIDSEAGYLLQFDAYSKDVFLPYFCTAWISSFANENETILIGGLVPLKIMNSICYATGREYRVFLSALYQISQCLNGLGPDPQSEEDSTDINILDILFFGDYIELDVPTYFIDIVDIFIKNTKELNIVTEHINESKYFSNLLLCFDEKNQPFVNLKNIQKMLCNVEEIVFSPGYKKDIVVSLSYFELISALLITCKLSSLNRIKICNVKLHENYASIGGVKKLLDSVNAKFKMLTGFELSLDSETEAIIIKSASSVTSNPFAKIKQQPSQMTVIY